MNRERTSLAKWVRQPIVEFFETEASGGITLILATVAALVWANSEWHQSYHDLWHTKVTLGWGEHMLSMTLHHWVNDGLMALFFFVVGLEIKRELLTGELSTPRKAALPAMGALGGMVAPALLYTALNWGEAGARGWGIPMATDIAFAIGILILLGKRIPLGLKVFLTALAVVDDLGAVLVIALFYTAQLTWWWLLVGLGLLGLLFVISQVRVRTRLVYGVVGTVVWFCFLKSGIHATVAGVLVALTIPHGFPRERRGLLRKLNAILDEGWRLEKKGAPVELERRMMAIEEIEEVAQEAASPLMHMEHKLAPWVSYGVVPVFALANAGVLLGQDALAAIPEAIPLGIILGLVIGKQIGILGFSWLAVRLGWCELPQGVSWRLIHGASALAGIGFTMSIFIAALAFPDPGVLEEAKMGVLVASLISALLGAGVLIATTRARGSGSEGG